MPIQQTLILIKPDAVQRGLIAEILTRFKRKGLRLVGMKLVMASQEQASAHYAEHAQKPFYPSLLKFITSSPLVALALEGDEAITVCRTLMGPTDGRKAPPGTIRGDFALSGSNNLVHGSDSPAAAERELKIWFPEGLLHWSKVDTVWTEAT
jgi:nucleoside-diphosphate kinase